MSSSSCPTPARHTDTLAVHSCISTLHLSVSRTTQMEQSDTPLCGLLYYATRGDCTNGVSINKVSQSIIHGLTGGADVGGSGGVCVWGDKVQRKRRGRRGGRYQFDTIARHPLFTYYYRQIHTHAHTIRYTISTRGFRLRFSSLCSSFWTIISLLCTGHQIHILHNYYLLLY